MSKKAKMCICRGRCPHRPCIKTPQLRKVSGEFATFSKGPMKASAPTDGFLYSLKRLARAAYFLLEQILPGLAIEQVTLVHEVPVGTGILHPEVCADICQHGGIQEHIVHGFHT